MLYPVYDRAQELFDAQLDAETIRHWLEPVGIRDWRGAYERLLRLRSLSRESASLRHLLPYLLQSLAASPDPDRVLIYFERYIQACTDPLRTVSELERNLRLLDVLIRLFSGSQFLTEILLHHPDYLAQLDSSRSHTRSATRTQSQLSQEFQAQITHTNEDLTIRINQLRIFQRREFLRIGAFDLLGILDLASVVDQLSILADCILQLTLETAARYTHIDAGDFVVIAMGKLGGGELNYSSDVDLLFLTKEEPSQYMRLATKFIDVATRVTEFGFLYRVDMRLRPWGSVGPLVSSLTGYRRYLENSARLWEKQALLKARPVAGNLDLGCQLINDIQSLIFADHGQALRDAVFDMKTRTERQLHAQGVRWGEVKLGEGSIRDVEFVVQYLQLRYGAARPEIRDRYTLNAIERLWQAGILSHTEQQVLTNGYTFFRTIEHHLQMMHYQQTHVLPQEQSAQYQLANRLGFSGEHSASAFVERYEQHRSAIRAVYLEHLGGERMVQDEQDSQTLFNQEQHLARMTATYANVFSAEEIRAHATLAARLSHDHMVEVRAIPTEADMWRVTIVGYDFPGELSLICGLLFAYGMSIEDGHVFTYEASEEPRSRQRDTRRKIVDVFDVFPTRQIEDEVTWRQYGEELEKVLLLMNQGNRREARGLVVKRVAHALPASSSTPAALYPVEIDIDNHLSEKYTVLRITAQDTIGFLYELTNALAYNRIYISQVRVNTAGDQVQDVLYVTDANQRKITAEDKITELRAAIVLTKHFTHLLPHCPDPETALLHFRQFISQLFQQPNWLDDLASLENPEVLNGLARVLGVSEFLWDDFLRMQYNNLVPVVQDVDALHTRKDRPQLQQELEKTMSHVHDGPQPLEASEDWRTALNAFKDREMFRIDMRHILGHTQEFEDFSEELTALAEVIVNATFHLCHEDLRHIYGSPLLENGQISDMVVCALGKCGGTELGFASDIELMFIYSGNGKTAGPSVISTHEFYEKLVQQFVSAIQAKREGIFEIDLRLRPYGESGSMAVSLAAFERYFAPQGPAWAYERQALVKLRPIAGNLLLGEAITRLRDAYVYTGDVFDVPAMRAMRERQVRHLVTGGTFNAKYSPGGLVDIEYLVQGLQITYAAKHPDLRQTNIRKAMAILTGIGALTDKDYTALHKAHTFLRWLIDGLRMVRGNAKDLTVPESNSEAFLYLAQRLRYGRDITQLTTDLQHHTRSVQMINQRLLTDL